MENIIKEAEIKMNKALETTRQRFSNIRAGRANPSILDNINVEYYESIVPLKQIATVTVPEARQLSIKPFDKTALNNIEKAIYEADIGLTPNNNGESIFMTIPMLTEERRKELVKEVKKIAEEGKINIRNARQDANNDLKKIKLSEDLEKTKLEEIQELTNEYNLKIDNEFKIKETELMSI